MKFNVEEKLREVVVPIQIHSMQMRSLAISSGMYPQFYPLVDTYSIAQNILKSKNYRIRLVIFDSRFYNHPFVLRVGAREFSSFDEVKSKAFSIMRNLKGDYPICAVLENADESYSLLFSGEITGVKGFQLSFNKNEPECYIEPFDII